MNSSKIYLPGLNGLRAIAALAVVFCHINNRITLFGLPFSPLWNMANHAVTIFFTLSGFLITYLLLKEKEISNTIDIKKFYVRRILRIWPLYYLYLFIAILVAGFSGIDWSILVYLFMAPNLYNVFGFDGLGSFLRSFIGLYWSLGVEEQFYVFWPWIIKKSKNILKYLFIIPILFVFAKFIGRICEFPTNIIEFLNYSRFGCLALGGYGAYLYLNKTEKIKAIINRPYLEILAWLFLLILVLNKFHITSIIDHEIVTIFTLILIVNQISNPRPILSLENRTLNYLGKISYGLYVYNPLAIYLASLAFNHLKIENEFLKIFLIYTLSVSFVIFIAHISYNYFEKYFLDKKSNYSVIRSSNIKNSK